MEGVLLHKVIQILCRDIHLYSVCCIDILWVHSGYNYGDTFLATTWSCTYIDTTTKATRMRLGFHYHIPAIQKEDGSLWMPGYQAVFIEGLAQECDEVICFLHTPLEHEKHLMDYQIKQPNIKLVDIGSHSGMFRRTLFNKKYISKIESNLGDVDIMLIRGPSPLLPFVASLCKKNNMPYSFLVVGDYLKSLKGVKDINYIKKAILWSFYKSNKLLQDYYANDALIFTNNSISYREYKNRYDNVHEIKTTTLCKEDLYKRNDTCCNSPVKLAYAGRIEPTKGIDDILDAVRLLHMDGINVELHLAGWDSSENEKYLRKLLDKSEENGLSDIFFYHGKKRAGEELFSFYRECDIFIVATKGNEGFPRTIWEAMSQSVPVISTKVGAIPDMLEDGKNVLLVDQSSPQQLAKSIKILIKNNSLRKKLIKSGYNLALANTIEIQSKSMIDIINKYLKEEL